MADPTAVTRLSFLDAAPPVVDPNSLAARKQSFDEQTNKAAADGFKSALALRESLYDAFWLGRAGLSPQQAAEAKGATCASFFTACAAFTAALLAIDPTCITPERQGIPADYDAQPDSTRLGWMIVTEKQAV